MGSDREATMNQARDRVLDMSEMRRTSTEDFQRSAAEESLQTEHSLNLYEERMLSSHGH